MESSWSTWSTPASAPKFRRIEEHRGRAGALRHPHALSRRSRWRKRVFPKSALVIAYYNVRKRIANGSVAGDGATRHPVKPQPKDAVPIITFDHGLTLHVGGEDIRVIHFTAAHTDGDSIVFFPKSNVVRVGDLFVTYEFPFVDLESGGSIPTV